jgi:hypothetical protein
MADFFISYTSADTKWAEWIAYVLEEERYSVILQAWDFRPGSNFVLEMQEAARKATKTIMVLSPDYMKSQFASPEWAAAFAHDPKGLKRKLIPVVVRRCDPDGLLAQIVHIDLTGLDQGAARSTLASGVRSDRAKPNSRPAFPGGPDGAAKDFPGTAETAQTATTARPYMPKVRQVASDADKRRFAKGAFETISRYFENALPELARHTRGLEFDFQVITAHEFTAEIFLNGKSVATCRIRYGGDMSRDGITYAEGRHFSSNSANEILGLSDGDDELALTALMGDGFGFRQERNRIDPKRMTPSQAAEYLCRRFTSSLER